MNSEQGVDIAVTIAVVLTGYLVAVIVVFRHTAARTPAGIVRRLVQSGKPVTVAVNVLNPMSWDPSRSGGFTSPGSAAYSLENPSAVRVHFQPKVGPSVDRTAAIPESLLPESTAVRRRRRIASAVTVLYLGAGVAAFGITAGLVHGTPSFRTGVGAMVGIGFVSIAWLATHFVLMRRRAVHGSGRGRPQHVRAWIVGDIVVSITIGIAWRIDSLDQTQRIPWPSAFLDAFLFVTLAAAMIAAMTHHHNYVHQTD